ncbi:MAG: hypothetical protein DRI79_03620 [Chloroflexi bacterium]|nr:MAG: hypothetical protein DRI80_01690 [Chloroflexota bacterium]RLC91150.1 MAG: hypothetical protein DRI79_03620 [Chloroflexota bacterium]
MRRGITQEIVIELISELHAWRIRALNVLLTIAVIAVAPAIVLVIVEATRNPDQWPAALVFLAIYLFIVGLAVFRHIDPRLRAWGMLLLGYVAGVLAFARGGLAGDGRVYLLVLPILALVLVGMRSGLIMAILSLLTYAVFAITAHLGLMKGWLVHLDNPLALADWIFAGVPFTVVLVTVMTLLWLFNRFQIRTLQAARRTAAELSQAHTRLAARSEELARRARHLEATARVAREAAAIHDVDELLNTTVHLISDRFGFYHAGVFLLDDAGEYAVLRAASSEGGQRMLERGHRLKVGEVGIVGWVAGAGEPRVALDVGEDAVFFDNPDLPRTRSEMALPLKVRDRVIGVLDVQSTEEAAFTEEDVTALQMMADQLAVAIENARLFAVTQASLQELNALYRQYTTQAWERFTAERPQTVRYMLGTPAAEVWRSCFERVRANGEPVTSLERGNGNEGQYTLAIPVRLRGIPIGVLGFRRPAERGAWQPHELAMVEAVAERLGLALENVRLLEEAQRRAHAERLTTEVTARIRTPMDVDTILQTAVKELGQVLRAAQVSVYLTPAEEETA